MNSFQSPAVIYRILSWVVTLLVPAALCLTAVRAMMTPLYLQFEYNSPGFPADPYGFTKTDRLYWSNIALDYLLNNAGISFLGDLRFKDGSPVYNERELRHMVDVKNTVKGALTVWVVSLVLLVVLRVWAWRGGWMDAFRIGMVRGGWLTVVLLAGILLFVLLGFGVFFVLFHDVFFQPGTWMFLYSDTLIRLFPERFWRDIFIIVGLLTIAGALLVTFLFRRH
ncbi:MAG: TIGR01906 family membrane protein [Anaerolineales bacterium]